MKILLLIPSLQCGGAERNLVLMANYWATRGMSPMVVKLDDKASFFELHPSIPVRSLEVLSERAGFLKSASAFCRAFFKLRRIFKAHRPDAVISFINGANLLSIVSGMGLKVPIIVTEHTDPSYYKGTLGTLRLWPYRFASASVVNSDAAEKNLKRIGVGNVVKIHNPIEVPQVGRSSRDDLITIVALGRLVHVKGFDLLIRAFAKLESAHPQVQLIIWGEGPERTRLEGLVRELKLSRVTLPGATKTPHEKLAGADLFVLSSRVEGFANVLCEAMALSVPSIAYDCPSGPREIIEHERNGLLVTAESVDALAQAIEGLLKDASLRERLGEAGKEVAKRFAPQKILAQFEDVIRKAMAP